MRRCESACRSILDQKFEGIVGEGHWPLRQDVANSGPVLFRGEDLDWSSYFKPYRHPVAGMMPVVAGKPAVEIVASPALGVWEFSVQPPSRADDSLQYRVPPQVELTVTALGVDAMRASGLPASDSSGELLTFRNRYGRLGGAAVVSELGARGQVNAGPDSTGSGPIYEIDVTPGTTSLRVEVDSVSSAGADVDLYLFDCTSGQCFLWDDAIGGQESKSLLVRFPRAGSWKAVVDPVGVAPGTRFRYTDILTNPGYGSVRGQGSSNARAPGEQWTDSLQVIRNGAMPSGRDLVLVSDVVDQALEDEEQAHSLAVFAGAPYRPVPLATVIAPVSHFK